MIIRTSANARVGIIGNPSDGFFGKTIAATIANFSARVTLWESPSLQIVPHPVHDPSQFPSLDALKETAIRDGYYGGMRLIFAACKRFAQYCEDHGIALPTRNFTITYDTDIPRQVGLAGSSAIVTATIKALMQFFDVTEEQLPKPVQPNLVLDVEMQELAIAAGLQDRVVQVYGGCVYMDFSRNLMESRGYGDYVPLDINLLPPMYLAWDSHPSDSGRIHSDVRARFHRGDPEVVDGMRRFVELTEEALEALRRGDMHRLAELMNANFDLRLRLYGEDVVGQRNLNMIRYARELGFPAKFPGSGGAVIGLIPAGRRLEELSEACARAGFQLAPIRWLAAPDIEPVESA